MIAIKVTCNQCWGELEYEVLYNQWDVEILVLPCSNCMQEERDNAYDNGYVDGEKSR